MPTFGVQTLFAMPFRKDASQTAVGEIRFELSFAAGRARSGPVTARALPSTVYQNGDTARQEINGAIDGAWQDPATSANVLSAEFDLKQFTEAINVINAEVDNLNDLNTVSDLIEQNSPSIVRDGAELADAFMKLWQTVSVGLKGGKGVSALLDLTSFGSELSLSLSDIKNASILTTTNTESFDIPLWDETTAVRAQRNQNRLSIVNAGRVAALVCAYEQAADTTYSTDAEIEETRLALETVNQRLMRVDTENKTLIQSQPEVRRAVEDVRLAALQVLDDKEQSVFSLATIINKAPVGSFSEAYILYAEDMASAEDVTNRGIEIRALNPTQAADKLVGKVTVLQS
jgi:hypothetical protein